MTIDKDLKFKWEKFKRDKRAFISFLILCSLFIVTTPAELLCNVRPILLVVDGKTYFPILFTYSEIDFGGTLPSEPDYLSKNFKNLLAGNPPNSPLLSTSKNNQEFFELGLDDFNDDEQKQSIPEYPDIEQIRTLSNKLNKAKDALKKPMWSDHDHFSVIDEEIEKEISYALIGYSNFSENPLIKSDTKNFRDLMVQISALIHSATFCRRRIQSIQPQLLPDFAMIEMNSTDLLLASFIKWSRFVTEYPKFTKEEWVDLSKEFKKYENKNKKRMGDMIQVCAKIISQVQKDGNDFIRDELPEVGRLIDAQIMVQDEIIIYDLMKVIQDGPFSPLTPTTIPPKLSEAIEIHRTKLYQRKNIDIEHEMALFLERIGHKIPAYGLLLNQGIIIFFKDKTMDTVLLTIQLQTIQNIHLNLKDIQLIYNQQILRFGFENTLKLKHWKQHIQTFCS